MRGILRPLGVLVVLQGMCLAAGLWLHDRFLVSAARWSEKSEATLAAVSADDVANDGVDQRRAADSTADRAAEAAVVGGPPSKASRLAEPEVSSRRLVDAMPAASLIAFIWTWGLQAVAAYFLLSRVHGEHSRKQSQSDEQTVQHTRDLLRTRDAVIFGLAKLAESRDRDTGHHLERISLYSTRLSSALSRNSRYRHVITPSFVRLIGISSALHDIGKVSVEDCVLRKPGELTWTERFRMQLHAEVGAGCIREIERRLGTSNFLEMAREIAYSHHERWDGTGYPQKLAGEQIPLAARIVAIADVYDALSVRRVYKDPLPHDECVRIIRDEAGRQFDPDLVRVFLEIEGQFREISGRFPDETAAADGPPRTDGSRKNPRRLTPAQEDLLRAALAECDDATQPLEPVA